MKNSPEGQNSICELSEERPGTLEDNSKQTVQSEAHKEKRSRMKIPQRVTIMGNKMCIKGLPEGEDREKRPNIYI